MVLGNVMMFSPFLHQAVGVLLRAPAADADQDVEMVPVVVLDDRVGHVQYLAAHQHPVRLVAAGAEDRAAQRQDAGERLSVQIAPCGFPSGRESRRGNRSTSMPIMFHAPPCRCRAGGVQAGAVTARG